MSDDRVDTAEPRGRRFAWPWVVTAVLLLVWLGVGGALGPFQGKLSEVQKNDSAAFLPASAESTRVTELQSRFAEEETVPAIVVYERDGGLTAADQATIAADVARIRAERLAADELSPPILAKDREAAQVVVPLASGDTEKVKAAVERIREIVGEHPGLSGHVAGPAGIVVDFSSAFEGIDGLLLLVTGTVVAIILVVVYRSPLLPLVVLLTVGMALGLSAGVVYLLAKNGVIDLSGQSQGILSVLVFGATTDYALLLVARLREEYRRHPDRRGAMGAALRGSVEPITASGGTVIAGLLCLLFSDLTSNQSLGPIGTIGIVAALLSALTFLPAALFLLGRAAFWPFRPRHGTAPAEESGLWARVAAMVGRRYRPVWVVTVLVLLGAVAFAPTFRASGVAQTDSFLTTVDSASGDEILAEHFDVSAGTPAVVIGAADRLAELTTAAKDVDGVVTVVPYTGAELAGGRPSTPSAPPKVVDGLVQLDVILADPPDSDAAVATVKRLREAVHAVDGADAKVGGYAASQLDTRQTTSRDLRVIVPIVLLVIFLILAALLRALVAPLLLIATVVLSFAATLGVGAVVFNEVLGFPGSDAAVPLFAFVFLVALGIDYNIFLMTRVREESARHGTRTGTLAGLRVTGGVITSAGVVLAATFSALAVLPLLFLAQLAFLVAFGVLLDALLVRSLLVPSLTLEVGRRIWWPGAVRRVPDAPTEENNSVAEAGEGVRVGTKDPDREDGE